MSPKVLKSPIKLEDNSHVILVPAKPRLVARDATAPKSPWKYHKVPTISTKGIPVSMKSILSCVLWRLHEYENNPLMPESFVLLTNDIELRTLAQKLNIPTLNFQEIHQRLEKMHLVDHDRQTVGQLEEEFSPEKREKVTIDVKRDANWKEDRVEPDSVKDVSVMEPQDQEAQVEESNKETLNCELTNDTPKDPVIEIAAGQSERFEDIPDEAEKARGAGSPKVNGVHPLNNEEKVVASVYSSPEDHSPDHLSGFEGKVSPIENATVEALKETTRDINITGKQQKSSSTSSSHVYGTVSESVGTSDDSDEDEVVVFDPRSRRFSGRPKTPNEITKPPPAISYIRALETGLPKKPVVTPKPSIPVAQQQNQKIQQPEIPNEVKPEGTKPQIPTMPDVQEASAKNVTSVQRRHLNRRPEPLQYSLHTAPKSQNQVPAQIQSRPDILPVEVSGPSKNTSPPKSPQRKKSDEQIVLEPVDQDGRRYQNQGTINRPSHPAVQRVDRAFAKSQRQIHKPQRPFPVIDPDAFDRSYIVRPHNHAPNTNHRVMSPRGSPRGGPRTPESEVDYVLKSGSPRGATRGRGKLWVP